jgi:hypothetical protein
MWACTQLARGTHLVYILNLASIHIYHTSLSLPPLPPWILLPLLPSYDPSQSFGSAYVHCASIDTSNRASEHACRWADPTPTDARGRTHACDGHCACPARPGRGAICPSCTHACPRHEGAVVLEGWGCMRAKLKASIVTRPRRLLHLSRFIYRFQFSCHKFDSICRKYVQYLYL